MASVWLRRMDETTPSTFDLTVCITWRNASDISVLWQLTLSFFLVHAKIVHVHLWDALQSSEVTVQMRYFICIHFG